MILRIKLFFGKLLRSTNQTRNPAHWINMNLIRGAKKAEMFKDIVWNFNRFIHYFNKKKSMLFIVVTFQRSFHLKWWHKSWSHCSFVLLFSLKVKTTRNILTDSSLMELHCTYQIIVLPIDSPFKWTSQFCLTKKSDKATINKVSSSSFARSDVTLSNLFAFIPIEINIWNRKAMFISTWMFASPS